MPNKVICRKGRLVGAVAFDSSNDPDFAAPIGQGSEVNALRWHRSAGKNYGRGGQRDYNSVHRYIVTVGLTAIHPSVVISWDGAQTLDLPRSFS